MFLPIKSRLKNLGDSKLLDTKSLALNHTRTHWLKSQDGEKGLSMLTPLLWIFFWIFHEFFCHFSIFSLWFFRVSHRFMHDQTGGERVKYLRKLLQVRVSQNTRQGWEETGSELFHYFQQQAADLPWRNFKQVCLAHDWSFNKKAGKKMHGRWLVQQEIKHTSWCNSLI